jgi:hypothetical protein
MREKPRTAMPCERLDAAIRDDTSAKTRESEKNDFP